MLYLPPAEQAKRRYPALTESTLFKLRAKVILFSSLPAPSFPRGTPGNPEESPRSARGLTLSSLVGAKAGGTKDLGYVPNRILPY